MALRRFVADASYLSDRNDAAWTEVFHAAMRAAELRLVELPWPQVNALPQWPGTHFYCLRVGIAALIFAKQGGRVIAQTVPANALDANVHGCVCVEHYILAS